MPTVKLPPDSNVTSEPPALTHYYPRLASSHLYLFLGALALSVVVRFFAARWFSSQKPARARVGSEKHLEVERRQPYYRKDSPASYNRRDSTVRLCGPALPPSSTGGPVVQSRDPLGCPERDSGLAQEQAQVIWAAGLLPTARHFVPAGQLQAMDGAGNPGTDGSTGSEQRPSRGVSNSPSAAGLLRHQQNPSPALATSGLDDAGRRRSSPLSRSPLAVASGWYSGGTDGAAASQRSSGNGKGNGSIDGGAWATAKLGEDTMASQDHNDLSAAMEGVFVAVDYTTPRHFSRPPQPPPLTPPILSTAVFNFEDRRPSYAVSIPPELDTTTFIHQPNPDYMGASTSADLAGSSSPQSASAVSPRRRSYNKSVPIGIPSASSQDTVVTSPDAAFSPSSYPPTSPLLPPPPPGYDGNADYEFGFETQQKHHGDSTGATAGGEIDLQGEIISVMDDAGHGWKRHTRVYGGGVCLACIASGEQGGFYGDKVPLEQRR